MLCTVSRFPPICLHTFHILHITISVYTSHRPVCPYHIHGSMYVYIHFTLYLYIYFTKLTAHITFIDVYMHIILHLLISCTHCPQFDCCIATSSDQTIACLLPLQIDNWLIKVIRGQQLLLIDVTFSGEVRRRPPRGQLCKNMKSCGIDSFAIRAWLSHILLSFVRVWQNWSIEGARVWVQICTAEIFMAMQKILLPKWKPYIFLLHNNALRIA